MTEDNGRTGHVYMDPEAQRAITGWCSTGPEAESHVERILDRLPAREREFIEAMAAREPEDRTATKIAAACGFPAVSNTGTFTRRLDRVRRTLSRGKPYMVDTER